MMDECPKPVRDTIDMHYTSDNIIDIFFSKRSTVNLLLNKLEINKNWVLFEVAECTIKIVTIKFFSRQK